MSYIENIEITPQTNNFSYDASQSQRVAQKISLFDGKVINSDKTYLFDNRGTGTGTWLNNKYTLQVTSGQYFIKQSKRYFPYFSGKSQLIEVTFDNFQTETDVIKRIGYFSSAATPPYDTNLDGFFIENNNGVFSFKAYRDGVITMNVPFSSFTNYNKISSYDWQNFTVMGFDFLWLGGTAIRIFMKLPNEGFVLLHTIDWAGTNTDTFIKSPNKPIRYEIRSNTGTGSLRYVCSSINTEGAIDEFAPGLSIDTDVTLNCNSVGTIYVLKAVRLKSTHQDSPVEIIDFSANLEATSDSGIISLLLNPTLSAPLTFTDVLDSHIQESTGTGETITSKGRVIAQYTLGQSGGQSLLQKNFLTWFGTSINGVRDEYYLCYKPLTLNQKVFGIINLKEY